MLPSPLLARTWGPRCPPKVSDTSAGLPLRRDRPFRPRRPTAARQLAVLGAGRPNSSERAVSVMATTAGCFSFRSTVSAQ